MLFFNFIDQTLICLFFRKYASQIACNQQPCPEAVHETKKPKTSEASTNVFGDSIFIDVEENKSPTDQPEPMFLEEPEAAQNEADQMVSIVILSLQRNLNNLKCVD